MMYYVKTHLTSARNRLQKTIIEELERWNGTLLTDEHAKEVFIGHMRDFVLRTNADFPSCRCCEVCTRYEGLMTFDSAGMGSFAEFNFYKVSLVYDGNTAQLETEEGEP